MSSMDEAVLFADVREYVSDVLGCPVEEIGAVTKCEDGNRHNVYRVACGRPSGELRDVVVRSAYDSTSTDLEMAGWEARVLSALGGVAAPLLYDYRASSRWFATPTMCLEFVPGRAFDLADAPPVDVERLGAVVARVHDLPVADLADGSHVDDVLAYSERRFTAIMSTLAWAREPLPESVCARVRAAADTVAGDWPAARRSAAFASGQPLALLHGDIAAGNVLWAQGPVLIDWEYARLGDPADDVANLLHQNGLSAESRAAFWRGYLGGGDAAAPAVVERIAWWEPLTLVGSTLWWIERWARRVEADSARRLDPDAPREPGYYRRETLGRLSRLECLLDREHVGPPCPGGP